ncbi:hypothetical protein ACM01_41045 [Streptomyces viridochromogenes]|uniref:Regulation of enolase 1 n=1 Tax=Streptomyces viridochromogenes TaxID=1938 RepID=A0A0J7YWK8_STRVR|nr:DUF1349 domain-containing protein [Streptomyces viridochromogenes]KMS67919.1 hypothetical protein ACM01_41045 [Streptomyces viridochromogenes]KOG09181.1 hypothetical protein ADK36_40880 [Streptomyces viridochromogenes]KOG25233.1 hypothetical protein ADK35_09250 [Streptomyces viridochromogenes]
MFDAMQWLNEPPHWSVDDGTLVVTTGDRTDFWRETFYDFVRDDGHFYGREVTGDFTAQVTLAGKYETLYDQTGLMLRVDENNWVKTGVEFTDGTAHLSCVVTRDFSDWSVITAPEAAKSVTLRLTRHGTAIRVQFRTPDGAWQLLRLGYLPLPATCQVGVMACSPQRAGFRARFSDFTVTEPIGRDLHA